MPIYLNYPISRSSRPRILIIRVAGVGQAVTVDGLGDGHQFVERLETQRPRVACPPKPPGWKNQVSEGWLLKKEA